MVPIMSGDAQPLKFYSQHIANTSEKQQMLAATSSSLLNDTSNNNDQD